MRNTRMWLVVFLFSIALPSLSWIKGIYVTQPTLESTKTLNYLIRNAKETGIDTFVVDYAYPSKRYRQNIELVKQAGITYVARVVMFNEGGLHSQITSQTYLNTRFNLIRQAVALGATSIQLDYIRYKATQRPSPENAKQIYNVIAQVRNLLKGTGVKLQIDIFGVAASGPSLAIGHDPVLFAPLLDAICPMVYPSHYEPFHIHAVTPYKTVYKSLTDLKQNLKDNPGVKIIAYIEVFNYRFPMSHDTKVKYILDEMRAARDAHADGYYVWSARNKYDLLFSILKS